MRDAVAALESAINELRQAEESLPADMTDQVRAVIERTQALLETLRAKESS